MHNPLLDALRQQLDGGNFVPRFTEQQFELGCGSGGSGTMDGGQSWWRHVATRGGDGGGDGGAGGVEGGAEAEAGDAQAQLSLLGGGGGGAAGRPRLLRPPFVPVRRRLATFK
jgi:hypothetical protein